MNLFNAYGNNYSHMDMLVLFVKKFDLLFINAAMVKILEIGAKNVTIKRLN